MVLSFSGDTFLAHRAARRALRARGVGPEEVVELGEGMEAEGVRALLAQGGLFGQAALYLDFDAAFKGQAGVKPRNETIEVLSTAPESAVVVLVDLTATAARQKRYREMGEHVALTTPRFGALTGWVAQELREAGVRFERDVPEAIADLFGDDLPSIASEIAKLALLDETLDAERVRFLVGRLASRTAFDLIEAVVQGNGKRSLEVCSSLLAQGEAPQRILGALLWQFDLVARCVAMRESRGRVDAGMVGATLKLKPFVAKKALAIAGRLDEERLRRVLRVLLDGDRATKEGRNEAWALEATALELAALFR